MDGYGVVLNVICDIWMRKGGCGIYLFVHIHVCMLVSCQLKVGSVKCTCTMYCLLLLGIFVPKAGGMGEFRQGVHGAQLCTLLIIEVLAYAVNILVMERWEVCM